MNFQSDFTGARARSRESEAAFLTGPLSFGFFAERRESARNPRGSRLPRNSERNSASVYISRILVRRKYVRGLNTSATLGEEIRQVERSVGRRWPFKLRLAAEFDTGPTHVR